MKINLPTGLSVLLLLAISGCMGTTQDVGPRNILDFTMVDDRDEMTDERRAMAFTRGDASSGGIRLILLCSEEGPLMAAIAPGAVVWDSSGRVRVQYRFGSNPASEVETWELNPRVAAAVGSEDFVNALRTQGVRSRELLVRFYPADGSEMRQATIGMRGLYTTIRALRCPPG